MNNKIVQEGTQLTILSKERIVESAWYPKGTIETIYFKDELENLKIEISDDKWLASCKGDAVFRISEDYSKDNIVLKEKNAAYLQTQVGNYVIYLESTNNESSVYHSYCLGEDAEISIGRSPDNDIVYSNNLASKEHAVLIRKKNIWKIKDCDSTNGVYVNRIKVKQSFLSLGDCIYIIGLHIIIGTDFISINDGNGRIDSISNQLSLMQINQKISDKELEKLKNEKKHQEFYSRSPRHKKLIQNREIDIEEPPMPMNGNKIPLFLRMGSSAIYGGSAALTGNFMPLASTLVFPFLNQKYSEKQLKEYEERRIEKYNLYLEHKKNEIMQEKEDEEFVLNELYPKIDHVLEYSKEDKRLWERRNVDDDFLNIRLGTGKLPLLAKINYSKKRFSLEEDELEDRMYELAKQKVFLENVPIYLSIMKEYIIGLKGREDNLVSFISNIISQIVLMHSYDEVKIVFLTDESILNKMSWIRYIPHIWDDRKSIRFLSTSLYETYQITDYLKTYIEKELERERHLDDILNERPYYVVIATNKKLVDSSEILYDVMKTKYNCGVSIITAFDLAPKDTQVLVDVKDSSGTISYLNDSSKMDNEFRIDQYDCNKLEKKMYYISNIQLKADKEITSLPNTVKFLDLFKVGDIRQLQPSKRWRENNPIKTLAVPIGIGADGELINLDIHEKFQGPHGLVAGTTGSGKSQFLFTYILSMAINFSPDEVSFVLIDYKGGGLAGAFVDEKRSLYLPHVMGTITNLDGESISRALISFNSELKRREKIFNDVRSDVNEGTMDIYSYQKLYRRGRVKEPMPHLIIISDEFAELRKHESGFMDQLISIARVGRSLGIHLILATQKPGGVVNDQIKSNSKFKVCLKVQDRSDSMDMLNRPEAVELKQTGRFYLQVGYNESFYLGQSGWSDAPYAPNSKYVDEKNKQISFIDLNGQVVHEEELNTEVAKADKTQLVAIVEMLSDLAKSLNIEKRCLWKEPLKERIDFDDELLQGCDDLEHIVIPIGVIDDPANQDQRRYDLDFSEFRNLGIVGESGCGKSTLIQTILLQLIKKYSAEELQFYLFDFSAKSLLRFKNLPHCGGVFTEKNEGQIDSIFKLLNSVVITRRKEFAKANITNFESARKTLNLPLILVVFDNIAGFAALKSANKYYDQLPNYLKEYAAYGIKFIISCTHMNDMYYKVKQEIDSFISIWMKDKYDYGEAMKCYCRYIPSKKLGRGLVLCGENNPLEIQFAMYRSNDNDIERTKQIESYLENIIENSTSSIVAKRLPFIPKEEEFETFCKKIKYGRIPLGYYIANCNPISLPLSQFKILSLYFGNSDSIKPILDNFIYALHREEMQVYLFQKEESEINEILKKYPDITLYPMTLENVKNFWTNLSVKLYERKQLILNYCEKENIDNKTKEGKKLINKYIRKKAKPICIIFEDLVKLCSLIDEEKNEKLKLEVMNILIALTTDQILYNTYYNLYIICCFYPENKNYVYSETYSKLMVNKMVMCFGGLLNKQYLFTPNRDEIGINDVAPYNVCTMKYNDFFYNLIISCGKRMKKKFDEDEASIFINEEDFNDE